MNKYIIDLKGERYLTGPEIINIYKIIGTLKTIAPLHLGSGELGKAKVRQSEKEDGENCALIERDYLGRPCIPGSSLKGLLRSFLETSLLPFNTEYEFDIASLSISDFEIQKGITNDDIDTKKKQLREEASVKKMSAKDTDRYIINGMAEFFLTKLDLIAGLFGFGRFKGKIEIDTAYIKEDIQDFERIVFTMPGVAIDRVTGTAKDKSLFMYELVSPGVEFSIEITIKNVRYWELGMMFSALNAFNNPYFPLRLGGLTNNGYGQMEWQIDKITQLGDDERKKAGSKVRNDIKQMISNSNREKGEVLSIEKRGFKNSKTFEEMCINYFILKLNKLHTGGV